MENGDYRLEPASAPRVGLDTGSAVFLTLTATISRVRLEHCRRKNMNDIASIFAATAIAVVVILPSSQAAQSRQFRDRSELSELSSSQRIDRADARIAILKADLRLTPDQAKNWSGFESAKNDVAVNRTKKLASYADPQTGRSASGPVAVAPADDADAAARDRDARANLEPDDILALRRESDALAAQSAALKQIADAAKPLYDSLDDRQRQRLVQFVHDDVHAYQVDAWRTLRR
jgi:hypothetical protein